MQYNQAVQVYDESYKTSWASKVNMSKSGRKKASLLPLRITLERRAKTKPQKV